MRSDDGVMSKTQDSLWNWLIGGFAGLVVGAIVAVNLIIAVGIGYDTSPVDVFRQSVSIGVVALLIQVAGPVFGIWAMRRLRSQAPSTRTPHGNS